MADGASKTRSTEPAAWLRTPTAEDDPYRISAFAREARASEAEASPVRRADELDFRLRTVGGCAEFAAVAAALVFGMGTIDLHGIALGALGGLAYGFAGREFGLWGADCLKFSFPRLGLIALYAFGLCLLLVAATDGTRPLAGAAAAAAFASLARTSLWAVCARLAAHGRLDRRVAVLMSGDPMAETVRRAVASWTEVRVAGLYDVARDPSSVEDMLRRSWTAPLDEIIVAVGAGDAGAAAQAIRQLRDTAADVRLLLVEPGAAPEALRTCLLQRRPLRGFGRVAKRAFDIVLSAALLVALAPVMLVIAAVVKAETRGSAFFCQRRTGFDAQPIVVYKFRTMVEAAGNDPDARQATRRDARVTRVGRWLRLTSLDELPQLINVLFGEMSLVGPRPHPLPLGDRFAGRIDNYFARNRIKPGLTGWAQVNGMRGETASDDMMRRRIELDLEYIDNWSLALDVKILLRTLRVPFGDKNAY